MTITEEIKNIKSDYLNDVYKLQFAAQGVVYDIGFNEDEGEFDLFNPYNILLFESSKNIILFENTTDEYSDIELYDISELVKDCIIRNKPKIYIRKEFDNLLYRFNHHENCILKIEQLFDRTVMSCLVDDGKLYKQLTKKMGAMEKVVLIDKYISNSIKKSRTDSQWICAEIINGEYRKAI